MENHCAITGDGGEDIYKKENVKQVHSETNDHLYYTIFIC